MFFFHQYSVIIQVTAIYAVSYYLILLTIP